MTDPPDNSFNSLNSLDKDALSFIISALEGLQIHLEVITDMLRSVPEERKIE